VSLHYEELPNLISCRLWPADLNGRVGSSGIDTRLIQPGELFWALVGEKADGHNFVAQAFAKGAQAAVVSSRWFNAHQYELASGSYIIVEDPLAALQNLAAAHRKRFMITLIALTGSNGKTATKELLGKALGHRYRVLKNAGNFNNHIGVPLTLLGITPDTEIILTEMGTNHPGEIAALCRIAAPDAGLVLNVGPAHLEGFGNIEAVAKEKGALLEALPESGVAFINLDDDFTRTMRTRANNKICFGFGPALNFGPKTDMGSDLCTGIRMAWKLPDTPDGRGAFNLDDVVFKMSWPGPHQINNGLAAAVVAMHFGIPIEHIASTFASMEPLPGRLETIEVGGVTIIDDSYNANPASTMAALNFLSRLSLAKRRFALLGDNLELGQASEELHRSIGRVLAGRNLQNVFLVGTQMQFAYQECSPVVKARYFLTGSDYDEITEEILKQLQPGDAVLVKASHGMGLDRIVRGLKSRLSPKRV
jgi:UDP-N-acetylmuramoyl-tripeptide--D-alanyl-D-alanine ligase